MKRICASAAAAAMLLGQTAYAAAEADSFRSPAPTPFTDEDIASFQLDAADAAKAEELRDAGYQVVALSVDELDAEKAGLSSTTWIIIGVVAIVILVVAADGGSY
jgi:hypothetical protein